MKMARVTRCEVSECSYNTSNMCHAMAITIGDGANTHCDTFCEVGMKGGDMKGTAGVGACKVSSCANNKKLECSCSEISIAHHGSEIDCMCFQTR